VSNRRLHILTALVASCSPLFAPAQDTAQISGHRLAVSLRSNHMLESVNHPAVTYQGKPVIQKMGLWITTGSTSIQASGAVCDVYTGASDFRPGPTRLNGGAAADTLQYNKVYTLRQGEVQQHRAGWKQPGYQPSENISNWPANGPKGFASVLAPYADVNRNGFYDPLQGDYPFVPEGELAYTISNDVAAANRLASAAPQGAEVQTMVWIPETQADTTLGLLAYFRFVVHNRSQQNWNGVALSLAADFSLGDASDDYLVTDVHAGGLAAYNGTASDAVFGRSIPAVAIYMLNRQVLSSMYFENTGDAVRGKPTNMAHYHYLARGRWKTGRNLAFGRAGLDGSIVTSYVYSNGTDPANMGIWNEGDAGNFPGNRTGLLTSDTFSLPAGGSAVLELALGVIRNVGNDPALLGAKMVQQKNAALRQQKNTLPGLTDNPIEMRLYEDKMAIRSAGNSPLNVSVYDMTARQLATFCFLGAGIVNLKNLPGNGPVVFMVSDNHGRQVTGKALIPAK
jgi:hypothetical protein